MNTASNADLIARFVAAHRDREYPVEVLDAAKQCLVDWFGVCLGALTEPPAVRVHRMVTRWGTTGNARMLLGGRGAPTAAALANGTLAHCLDYDDTHLESILHGSGPTWAATLAVGTDRGSSERDLLSAFITGFEVGTRIGNQGIGERLNHRGWHTTCVLGHFSSAVAASVLLGLDETKVKHALGLAATQVSGLTASIGTMAKPFHVGKTASDGVLAAELAAQDFEAATDLLDSEQGLIPTLFQDRSVRMRIAEFGTRWEVTRNSFKPYAACQLTHASIDSARRLAQAVGSAEITRVQAFVNPLAIKLAANTNPTTQTQARFSLAYTVALGLAGRRAALDDFSEERLRDTRIADLARRVDLIACEEVERAAARLIVTLADGRTLTDETPLAYGSFGNAMQWPDLKAKFMSMAKPALGRDAVELFDVLRDFEAPGRLRQMLALLDSRKPDALPALTAAR